MLSVLLLDGSLLLGLLGCRRDPRMFRHGWLEVLMPCQRQHVDTVFFPIRQTAPYETLKLKTKQLLVIITKQTF